MNILERIGRFLGSDFWYVIGFLRDIPELIWLWFTDHNEYEEMKDAIIGDIKEYFNGPA